MKPGEIYVINDFWIRRIDKIKGSTVYFTSILVEHKKVKFWKNISLEFSSVEDMERSFSKYDKASKAFLSGFKKFILKKTFLTKIDYQEA